MIVTNDLSVEFFDTGEGEILATVLDPADFELSMGSGSTEDEAAADALRSVRPHPASPIQTILSR